MTHVTAVRGMNDIAGDQSVLFDRLEMTARELLAGYGYAHVRLPVVEKTELFCRSIGEVTDIVEKEMYTFADRNGDSLTLRPEGTAGCVRAVLENGWQNSGPHKVYYMGPMFRHERPQKGRYRQFHQLGVETFGMAGPDIDAEMILLTARLWKRLGIEAELLVNSLGSAESRAAYREALTAYFSAHMDQLDEDSQKRLHRNPLRILDSKNPDMRALIAGAPSLSDWLDEEGRQHFSGLLAHLDAAGVAYRVEPTLVRGLDYYNHTVFEWVTHALGSQGTICAGGRYDGLVTQLGGKPTPAVGFAMGMERVVALMQKAGAEVSAEVDAYLVSVGEVAASRALALAERWRDVAPELRLVVHHGGGSFKSQFKKADKSGARWALVLGDDEVSRQQVGIKPLRDDSQPQQMLDWAEVPGWLRAQLA